ncbi:MAG: hypothetical protein ABJB66_00255 [Gemmatimonadaceae bacterium]
MIIAGLALAALLSSSIAPSEISYSDLIAALQKGAASSTASVTNEFPQPGRFDPTRFDSVTAGALRILFDSASAHGIPTTPLINKANFGAAQHKPGSQILRVVRDHFAAMLDARAALGDNSSDSELDSGADALRSGIDGKALVAIRSTRTTSGSSVNALVVLTDLVKRGIPSGKARDAVTALARVSKTDETINGLQVLVARNAERGPGMAQDAMDRYLRINAPGGNKNAPPKSAPRPPGSPDPQ